MEFNSSTVYLGLAVIAFIAWLVRLESKANVTANKVMDIDADLYKHADDSEIHHRGEDLDRRFENLQNGIDKIEKGIEQGFSKINDRIDRLMVSK